MESIKSRKIRALLAGGLILGLGATATLAQWTDQVGVTGSFAPAGFELEESNTLGVSWRVPSTVTFSESFPLVLPLLPLYQEAWIRVKAGNELPDNAVVQLSATITGATSPPGSYENNAHFSYKIYDISSSGSCLLDQLTGHTPVWSGDDLLTGSISVTGTLPSSTVTTKGTAGSNVKLCFVLTPKNLLLGKGANTVWTFIGTPE